MILYDSCTYLNILWFIEGLAAAVRRKECLSAQPRNCIISWCLPKLTHSGKSGVWRLLKMFPICEVWETKLENMKTRQVCNEWMKFRNLYGAYWWSVLPFRYFNRLESSLSYRNLCVVSIDTLQPTVSIRQTVSGLILQIPAVIYSHPIP
jgi:hypothetical protein